MTKPLLLACPACMRHVRVSELRCPFCGSDVPSSFREQEAPAPIARLSRAALYALRAGALSMTAAACGGAVAKGEGGGSNSSATVAPPYGGVPADASVMALYGGFFPVDASLEGAEDGGLADGGETVVAAYGAFIPGDARVAASDGGDEVKPADASDDQDARDNYIVPYGLPPNLNP